MKKAATLATRTAASLLSQKRAGRRALLPLLLLTLVSNACQPESDQYDGTPGYLSASLAFHVSTATTATRMSDAVTQNDGQFRGIAEQYLFPFNTAESTTTSLDRIGVTLTEKNTTYHHFFDNTEVNLTLGTNHFLCYAKAGNATESTDKAVNGSLTTSGLDGTTVNTANIFFTPKEIYSRSDDWPFTNENRPFNIAVETASTSTYFIYPPELWYYANSDIKTSDTHRKDDYEEVAALPWNDVLYNYEHDNGTVEVATRSVAIKEPLNYAVGCLRLGIVISSSTLKDANETAITLSPSVAAVPATNETPAVEAVAGTFPLKAVFITGQYPQQYDFTPVTTVPSIVEGTELANYFGKQYIIYDSKPPTLTDSDTPALTMGDSRAATPTIFSNTLALQSVEGETVRFAMEFLNNSGQAFETYNGPVAAGAQFYMVGSITVPAVKDADYKKRVFTKDYITQGTVTISSLKQAYPTLPDLLNPLLEVNLELVPNWIQSSTTNVPL